MKRDSWTAGVAGRKIYSWTMLKGEMVNSSLQRKLASYATRLEWDLATLIVKERSIGTEDQLSAYFM